MICPNCATELSDFARFCANCGQAQKEDTPFPEVEYETCEIAWNQVLPAQGKKKKPSKEFFGYILSDLGLEPSEAIMVGDDFEADVVGANNCGIRAIWYNSRTEENRESPMHRTVHDLRSLPQALETFWQSNSSR